MKLFKRWHLKDIILIALISLVCGVIFLASNFIYTTLTLFLTPLGLAPFSNEILFGLWTIAGPLSAFIIKIPGAGFLGEVLGSMVEMFLGGLWGASTLISGFVQGIAAECGFAFFKYKKYNFISLLSSVLTITTITYVWSFFKDGYNTYSIYMNIAFFTVRFLSVFLFSGVLVMFIVKELKKSELIN